MPPSSDAASALDTSSRTSYTAQLPPEQLRWLRAQAETHNTTVDQFLRTIVATAIDGSEDERPSRSADESADGDDDTVLSRLREAEKTLQALQSAEDPDGASDDDPALSSAAEDPPPSTGTEESSSEDEDPPSSLFDFAEASL